MERWKKLVEAGLMKYPEEPVEEVKPKTRRGDALYTGKGVKRKYELGHPGEDEYYTLEETAQRLRLSPASVSRMTVQGILEAVKRQIQTKGGYISTCSFFSIKKVEALRKQRKAEGKI